MNHLTEDQLSAFADGALPERERSACEAHLADCEACRARLTELSALDRSLAGALEHDPGEAYFESFADRVAARIAAQAPAAARGERARATPSGAGGRSPLAWLFSPRGLSFVGGTAVLVAVASLAWMRFQDRDGVMGIMSSRPMARSGATRQEAAPGPVASQEAPRPQVTPARPVIEPTAPPVEETRAREIQRNEREADVQPMAEAAPPPAPTPASAKRMAAPEASAPAPAAAKLQAAEGAMALRDAGAGAESAAGLVQDRSERRITSAPMQALTFAKDDVTPCGSVHDSRGTPIAGARVTVTNDGLRTTRSGPDGRFCLPRLAAGDTLSILRVGYEPQRVVVGPATSLAVKLEPIGTLGPDAGKVLAGQAPTALAPRAGAARRDALVPPPAAPAADVYEGQSEAVRLAVVDAREADEIARREGTARAHERSSEGWAKVASRATGAAVLDARFHALGSLRAAYRTEPTPARRARLQAGLAAFVASAPPSLPERATVMRWQAELAPPGGKALYR